MSSLASAISRLSKKYGLRLNTDLGQHFLTSQPVIRDMLQIAQVRPGERIVEVGAGMGILTKALLGAGARVTAIEVDKRWIPILEEYVGDATNLTILHGNALKVSMPEEPYKIVANIPYQITTRLLRTMLLHTKRRPLSMTLLVQREVAQKVCNVEKGGMTTVLVGLFGTAKIVRTVPPGSFVPPPRVESAVLHIACFERALADERTINRVLELASKAFGKKRKMLRASLGKIHGVMERLESLGIAPERRPETLSIAEWVRLGQISGENVR